MSVKWQEVPRISQDAGDTDLRANRKWCRCGLTRIPSNWESCDSCTEDELSAFFGIGLKPNEKSESISKSELARVLEGMAKVKEPPANELFGSPQPLKEPKAPKPRKPKEKKPREDWARKPSWGKDYSGEQLGDFTLISRTQGSTYRAVCRTCKSERELVRRAETKGICRTCHPSPGHEKVGAIIAVLHSQRVIGKTYRGLWRVVADKGVTATGLRNLEAECINCGNLKTMTNVGFRNGNKACTGCGQKPTPKGA